MGLSKEELGLEKNFYRCEKLEEIYKKKVLEEETV
jgi:hypothetical protein